MQSFQNRHICPNCEYCIELIPAMFYLIRSLSTSEQHMLQELLEVNLYYLKGLLSNSA